MKKELLDVKCTRAEKSYLEKYKDHDDYRFLYIQAIVATATTNQNGFKFTDDCLKKSYKTLLNTPLKAWRIGNSFTTHKDRVVGFIKEVYLEEATDKHPTRVVVIGVL